MVLKHIEHAFPFTWFNEQPESMLLKAAFAPPVVKAQDEADGAVIGHGLLHPP